MKKIMVCFAVVVLLITLSGCTNREKAQADGVVRVLMPFEAEKIGPIDTGEQILDYLSEAYMKDEEAIIEKVYIDAKGYDEYVSKRNSLLLSDNPPELFLLGNSMNLGGRLVGVMETEAVYKELGLAEKLSPENLPSYEKIFEGLKNPYRVPIALRVMSVPVSRTVADRDELWSLIKPVPSQGEELALIDQWVKDTKPSFDRLVFEAYYTNLLGPKAIYDEREESFLVNSQKTKDAILALREKMNNPDIGKSPTYNFMNYYQAIFVPTSDEYRETESKWSGNSRLYRNQYYYFLKDEYEVNLLNGYEARTQDGALAYHYISPSNDFYESVTMVVNKNGGDKEEALRFLEYMISHRRQVYLYDQLGQFGVGYSGVVQEVAYENVVANELGKPFTVVEPDPFGQTVDAKGNFVSAYEKQSEILQEAKKINPFYDPDQMVTQMERSYEMIRQGDLMDYRDYEYLVGKYNRRFKEIVVEFIFADEKKDEVWLEEELKRLASELELQLIER